MVFNLTDIILQVKKRCAGFKLRIRLHQREQLVNPRPEMGLNATDFPDPARLLALQP